MYEVGENGAVDAATYFEQRHGRKAFVEKNASQISFGDATYDPFKDRTRTARPLARDASRCFAADSATQSRVYYDPQQSESRPGRRPRGPGTDFARHIEEHGFPAEASRRSARVDATQESLYHYQPEVLRTQKKLTRLPFRSKQCDANVQLFLRPEEAVARSAAQQRRLLFSQQNVGRSSPTCSTVQPRRSERDQNDSLSFSSSYFTPVENLLLSSVPSTALNPNLPNKAPPYANSSMSQEREDGDQAKERSAVLRDRLRLLEELYAREYARLQESTIDEAFGVNEGEGVEDEEVTHGAHQRIAGQLASASHDTSISAFDDHSYCSQRRRRARLGAESHCAAAETSSEREKSYPLKSSLEPQYQYQHHQQRLRRDVQPWEREYGREEPLGRGSGSASTSRSTSATASPPRQRRIESVEDDEEADFRIDNVDLAVRAEPRAMPERPVRNRREGVLTHGAMSPHVEERSEANERVVLGNLHENCQQAHPKLNLVRAQSVQRVEASAASPDERKKLRALKADGAWEEHRAYMQREAQLAGQRAHAALPSPQAWFITSPHRSRANPACRHVDGGALTSPSRITPTRERYSPPHVQQHQRTSPQSAQHAPPIVKTEPIPYFAAQSQTTSFRFPCAKTQSLRDVCAERQASQRSLADRAEPAAHVSLAFPAPKNTTKVPQRAPQTLRDVIRALQS